MFPVVLWMAAYSKNWGHADGVARATRYLDQRRLPGEISIRYTCGSWSIC